MTTRFHTPALTCLSLLGALGGQAAQRPNIVYIFTDQHTATALSCADNGDVHTPHLDRLAQLGVRFTNAYCTSPLSGPSRGAMFTGHYPEEVGLAVNGAPLPPALEAQTLGTLVSQAGYACAYAGKWHLPEADIPQDIRGFKRLHPHQDRGLAEACVQYLDQPHTQPFFLVASFDNPHNICEYARSQNLPDGNLLPPTLEQCPGLPPNFAPNPYEPDVLAQERLTHFNIYPTTRYTSDDWRRYRYQYYRLVEKVDREIGLILEAMDRKGLWENTIVVFSSDHGDGIGAHQWNQKSALHEEVVNVPLIVTLPHHKGGGRVLPQLINNGVDLFSTLCHWAGVTPPKGTCGISFHRLVEDGKADTPHQAYVVTETRFDGSTTRGWMLRTDRYKYVLYDKGRYREQLFDMHRDRGEMRNLALEQAHAQELKHHRRLLTQWMTTHHTRTTRANLPEVPYEVL